MTIINMQVSKNEGSTNSPEEWKASTKRILMSLLSGNSIEETRKFVPDWITAIFSIVPGSVGTTILAKDESSYWDGLNSYWKELHYFDVSKETLVRHTARGWSNEWYSSELFGDGKYPVGVDAWIIDATDEIKQKVAAYENKLAMEKAASDEVRRVFGIESRYQLNVDNHALVVAIEGYKPRKNSGKTGFPEGSLGLRVFSGVGQYGSYYIVRHKNVDLKDRDNDATILAANDKFNCYVPSCEIENDSVDDTFGYLGKYLSTYIFNQLFTKEIGFSGLVITVKKYDLMMREILEFIQVDAPKVLDFNRRNILVEEVTDYYSWSKVVLPVYEDYFKDIVKKAKEMLQS
jgi:hypothetical protein